MLSGHQRITWRRNIAENFNRLSKVHERYRRQTDRRQTDRQTDGRRHIANMNMSSRSLKTSEPRKSSYEKAVKRVDCDKTEEKFAQIFIPYELRKITTLGL